MRCSSSEDREFVGSYKNFGKISKSSSLNKSMMKTNGIKPRIPAEFFNLRFHGLLLLHAN